MFNNFFGGNGCGHENTGCSDCTWIIILILLLTNCGCRIDPCMIILILLLLGGCGCGNKGGCGC